MSDSYEQRVCQAFDSFCKTILKHEVRDYYDEVKRQKSKEVLFSELPTQGTLKLSWSDDYPSDYFIFVVKEYTISLKNEMLAKAISSLPENKRNIILLAYFLEMTDKEIGNKLNLPRRTVHFRRTNALREIQKRME